MEAFYCNNCQHETLHFRTMGLELPCCRECSGLNERVIFGTKESLDKEVTDRVMRNALIETRVLRERRGGGRKTLKRKDYNQ